MLAILSLVPVILVLVWLTSEFRGKTLARVTLGIAALGAVAVTAFLWGSFVEGLRHSEFPVPHDNPTVTTPDGHVMEKVQNRLTYVLSKGPDG